MKEKVVLKKIDLELFFDAGFVPPKKFDVQKCKSCPFHEWDDESEDGCCALNLGVVDVSEKCPIKKFF